MIHFDLPNLQRIIHEDEQLSNQENFWNDQNKAKTISERLSVNREKLQKFTEINDSLTQLNDFVELLSREFDADVLELANIEYETLMEKVQSMKHEILFSGEFDDSNAILYFHPGAGGTESQDWADMLVRMYVRWAEINNLKITMLDYQTCEDAGIKSASLQIKGKNVYGLLKGEKGVHRLVRISPFDASGRRHTSFASVNVIPEFKNNVDIEILEKDLKIDTYRSQGAGGQNVNKTESAVRITHLPTGIVVSCQIDRSQIRNREMAMEMLKGHLYQRRIQEQKNALNKLIGEQKNIEWGSQIRSYVFCPYTMVKDHRTDYQEGDVGKIMNGYIDAFLYSYLEMEAKNNEPN